MRANFTRPLCVFVLMMMAMPGFGRSVAVDVAPVVSEEIAQQIELIGTIHAVESVDISASVQERVTQLHFQDGDLVEAGTILVELDDTEEQAELAQAQSVLKEARSQFNRLAPLVKQGASPQSTLDTAKQRVQSAQSMVRVIESRIAQHSIPAPFDGTLGVRRVSIGALVQPGQALTSLDVSRLEVALAVPLAFRSELSTEAMVTMIDVPELAPAAMTSFDSRAQKSQAVWAYATLPDNAAEVVLPGQRINALLTFAQQQSLVVPETAVVYRGAKTFVFVVEEQTQKSIANAKNSKPDKESGAAVTQREVELGVRAEGLVQILSGVELGRYVVAVGAQQLKSGDTVTYVHL